MTRRIAAFVAFLLLLLAGCRSQPERSAVARTAENRDGGDKPALTPAERGEPGDRNAVETRRLWAGNDFNFYASSPSPDGRWVTEIDWSTGDLAVRDLTTGRLHHLTEKGSWEESGDYAEVSTFAPDGRRVVYSWYSGETDEYQVRVLDFAVDEAGIPRGSNPRVIYPGSPLMPYWMYAWNSDDEILTGIYRPDNTTALGFLSLSTGELRVLKSFDWREAHAALSPDGRFIAYDHPPGPDPLDREIYLLSADGSRQTPLVEGPGRDVVLGWVPGDGSLLFYSERSGSPSVWRLPMEDGRPSGPVELVREDVRKLEPLGFAGDDFYFGVEVEAPTFRTARIDVEGRALVELPTTFDAPYGGGFVRALAWSPDGEHVVHDVADPAGTWIYLRTAGGDVVGEWKFDLDLRRWVLRWAPDGSSVLLPAIDDRGRGGFFRIDLESGELEMVRRFDPPGESGRSFSISPDGRSLYFTRVATRDGELDESLIEIVAYDLQSGHERSIHRVRYRGPVVASPDGAWLAYHERAADAEPTIQLFPADGGEPRTLHRVEGPGRPWGILGWTPDSSSVLFLVRLSLDSDAAELWRVSRDGEEVEKIAALPDYVGGGALHPDGRTIAYRAGRHRGEIWALDGLGAPVTAATGMEDSR